MMARRSGIGGFALFFTGLLSACYSYRPTLPAEIAPQQRVRVTVSGPRRAELASVLRRPGPSFTATYLNAGNGELLFEVPLRATTAGMPTTTLHNRISVPAADVVAIEMRELSTWRTGAAIAAIAAGLTFAAVQVFGADSDADVEKRGEVEASRLRPHR